MHLHSAPVRSLFLSLSFFYFLLEKEKRHKEAFLEKIPQLRLRV